MSTNVPKVICETNLSYAWGRAFLHVLDQSKSILAPLVVTIEGFDDGVPEEVSEIRVALDSSLLKHDDKFCSAISAAMIFPYKWSDPILSKPRDEIYKRYINNILPRLKALCTKNRYGTYFDRMIAFKGAKKENGKYMLKQVNQLEQIICDWTKERNNPKRPRHSALQITCFDPAKDHTGQSVRGFPCLQQISLAYDDNGGMALNAYYPTQYIYDRAYGNYLGLCYLGRFMAREMKLTFVRFTCFIGHPELGDVKKQDIRELVTTVRKTLDKR